MSLEDPFFVVRGEVVNALTKSRNLYQRWCDLQEDPNCGTKEEQEWTTTELRNGLRSIEWDLEDLDECLGIVENNPKKFKLEETEIDNRRTFITQTKEEVKSMREKLFDSKANKEKKMNVIANAVRNNMTNGARYTRLQNEMETSPLRTSGGDDYTGITVEDPAQQQQLIVHRQDDQLDRIRDSVGNLKSISRAIGREADEQAVMLDELGTDIEVTDSRLDTALRKVAKVLHLSNDRRQWMAVGVLTGLMLIILVLLFCF